MYDMPIHVTCLNVQNIPVDLDGSFSSAVVRNASGYQVRIPARPDVCHRGFEYGAPKILNV